MNINNQLADQNVLQIVGEGVSQQRLQRNLSQADLASNSGVSKRTIERIEAGESIQLTNFVRILRALDLLDGFDRLIPVPMPSPIEQLKLQGRQRQRASSVREPEPAIKTWTWKDDP